VSIVSPYWNCSYQGIAVGWSDNYNGGIPCQWIDVTPIPTSSSSVRSELTVVVNQKDWLCEGLRHYNASTNEPEFVSTGEYTLTPPYSTSGKLIEKFACTNGKDSLDNNLDRIPAILPTDGNGYLTSTCHENSQTFGQKRDCEFNLRSSFDQCSPGKEIYLSCSIKNDTFPQVLRICESSIALKSGTACRYNDDFMLANIILYPEVRTNVTFTCPGYRDSIETGGFYSTYAGPLLNGIDKVDDIECE
jgi:hypothetical protein